MKVFVTGTNRGLGFELTKVLAENGHIVFAGAYTPVGTEGLEELRGRYPGQVEILELDITDDKSVKEVVKTIENYAGALDGLVNNAGVLLDKEKTIDELSIDEMRKTFEINTISQYRVIKAALPLLYKGKDQVLVNISSEASSISNVGINYCSYSMSKVALTMMTQMFANLLNDKDIRVYAIHPGRMNTVMGRDTAQIEPSESASGIYQIITGKVKPELENGVCFINYKGEAMEL